MLRCARNDGVWARSLHQFASSSQTQLHSLAAHLARALLRRIPHERGRREDREPVGSHRPLCQEQIALQRTAENRATGTSRPSLRDGWNGLCRALPGERCTIAPVALRMADARVRLDHTHHRNTWRTDPGRQDHTIWPYADHTGRMRDGFAHGSPPCEVHSRRCSRRPPRLIPRS